MSYLLYLIIAVMLCFMASSCATFKDHYSIGVKAYSELEEISITVPTTTGNRSQMSSAALQVQPSTSTTYRLKIKCDTASCGTNFQGGYRLSVRKVST